MRSVSKRGLYDPFYEHDACGFGFVANIDGRRTHDIVRRGITVLENLVHRGACGCDPETGDGAGLLLQTPHKFFAEEAENLGFDLPEPGSYAAAMIFLPHTAEDRESCIRIIEQFVAGHCRAAADTKILHHIEFKRGQADPVIADDQFLGVGIEQFIRLHAQLGGHQPRGRLDRRIQPLQFQSGGLVRHVDVQGHGADEPLELGEAH
ncbi:MAG: hypothetical protein IID61_10255 [SAR324 cluster bacterium]|nr:hypothetical protein [SAR324 cluster bacterium]